MITQDSALKGTKLSKSRIEPSLRGSFFDSLFQSEQRRKMDNTLAILKAHYQEGITDTATHKAAGDPRLKTSTLIEYAKEALILEYEDDPDGERPNYLPLITLHHRTNPDTLARVLPLFTSDDPIDRRLACRILKEFPQLGKMPTIYSPQIIAAIEDLLTDEEDEDVISVALVAASWQCHPDAQDLMIKFSSDERFDIRATVSSNISFTLEEDQPIPLNMLKAILSLLNDKDEDVVWGILYDIEESPEYFQRGKEDLREVLESRKNDPDERLKELAESACLKLYGPA